MNLFTHLGCIGLHHLSAYVYATAYIMFVCTICFRYVQIETRYDLPYYFVKKRETFVRSHLCGVSSFGQGPRLVARQTMAIHVSLSDRNHDICE